MRGFIIFNFNALLLILVAALPTGALAQDAGDGFRQVAGPCHLVFPDDHGPHPAHRTEWWYYTGNLAAGDLAAGDLAGNDGRRFGFQLTFFRTGLRPPRERQDWPDPASAWRSDQLFLAHLALSDIETGRHYQAEQMLRPVLGLAGAGWKGHTLTLHLNDWRISIAPQDHQLAANTGDFSLGLDLTPDKGPVLHGDAGYSQKGTAPERASCYYSFTRLRARGVVTVDGERHEVQGSAWMDHEFSTAPLEPGLTGWDWFSLQLSDRTELMIYLLRQADGGLHPASSGTFVEPSGESRRLGRDEIQIQPSKHWLSPHTGARYPISWRVSVAPLNLELTVEANLADQEMRTPGSTGVDYWEGSVRAKGSRGGVSVDGGGYVELTGYAEAFDAPM
jgi:predicted secreted hydrolase